MIRQYCRVQNYTYMGQSNIKKKHIGKDGLHLNRNGSIILKMNVLKQHTTFNPYLCTFENEYEEALWDELGSKVEINNNQSEREILSGDIRVLNEIRIKYVNNVVIGHLNIKSLANKFDKLKSIIKDTLDVLVVVETKIDESFPEEQFKIEKFSKPYRLDRNIYGGGIIIYVKENIPSKELKKHKFTKNMETLFIEFIFKWFSFEFNSLFG